MTLVGQHGAGLTNMIWMKPGGTIIEILSPQPDYVMGIYANLAKACGHTHLVVHQEHDHAPIDGDELLAAIRRVVLEVSP